MGQRFQILVKTNKRLYLYHAQWLWGEYAIRRIGSFIYAINQKKKIEKGYFDIDREIRDCLFWGFNYKLSDQNKVHPYFDSEILEKEDFGKKKNIKDFLESLDNNNGQFILGIKDSQIPPNKLSGL